MLHIAVRPSPRAATPLLQRLIGTDEEDDVAPVKSTESVKLGERPANVAFVDFLSKALGSERGVVMALPIDGWTSTRPPPSRIVQLDPDKALGRNWWWLHQLKRSGLVPYGTQHEGRSTYRTRNDPQWLQPHLGAEVDALKVEALVATGIAVEVQEVESEQEETMLSFRQIPRVSQRLLMHMEAAAGGIAPAVLACLAVYSGEAYGAKQPVDSLSVGMAAEANGKPIQLQAMVMVTQAVSFTLDDWFLQYNAWKGDPVRRPSVPEAELHTTLDELTDAVARKVRQLTQNRILKLNMTPEHIVVCPVPELEEQEWKLTKGWTTPFGDTDRGVPLLVNFDTDLVRRFAITSTDWNPDCAYFVMMLVLLSAVKARHGEVATRMKTRLFSEASLEEPLRMDKVLTRMRSGTALVSFCGLLTTLAGGSWAHKEAPLHLAIADVASDLSMLVRQKHVDPQRAVFVQLLRYLLISETADSTVFASARDADDEQAAQEQQSGLQARLRAVIEARKHR